MRRDRCRCCAGWVEVEGACRVAWVAVVVVPVSSLVSVWVSMWVSVSELVSEWISVLVSAAESLVGEHHSV